MLKPETSISTRDVFPNLPSVAGGFMQITWNEPVSYFVGRNGSGKSRAARALARSTGALYLSTDRLLGIMNVSANPNGTSVNPSKGVTLEVDNPAYWEKLNRENGMATQQLRIMREDPEIALRVAAFIRRTLGRVIELRETAGYLDPFVRLGDLEYSLVRDEGHGLRELVILLAALYRNDWSILIVDEPELHLHPALARLWLSELERTCRQSHRNAVVVTHEPSLIRPRSTADLDAIWLFSPGRTANTLKTHVPDSLDDRIAASLRTNPNLVGQLVFAPRPVLVEGAHDVAAFTAALARTQDPLVVAQTDFIRCGSSNAVAMWFVVAKAHGVDVLAIADLDAVFNSDVQRLIGKSSGLQARYRNELFAEPPAAHAALRPLIEAANRADIPKDDKSRARWLADLAPDSGGLISRRNKLIEIWRQEGMWLHPEGTLEDVLQIEKGKADPAAAAEVAGAIDKVSDWCAYKLDQSGDLKFLLGSAVERIAGNVNLAQGVDPKVEFSAPVGPSSVADSRIADIRAIGPGRYRLTVKTPEEFAGFWLEFDRDTSAADMKLKAPELASPGS